MINKSIFATGLALATTASLTACQKPEPAKPAVDTCKISDAVKADAHDYFAAINAHDAAKAVAHDAPDFTGMFHGAPNVHGPAEDLTVTTQELAGGKPKLDISAETVDVPASGDMAVYHAAYTVTHTDPKTSKMVTESGNTLLGYKQVDGAWKIAWSIVSDAAPAPAAPPAKKAG